MKLKEIDNFAKRSFVLKTKDQLEYEMDKDLKYKLKQIEEK